MTPENTTCVPLEGMPTFTCVDDNLLVAFGFGLIFVMVPLLLVEAYGWITQSRRVDTPRTP